MQQSNQISLSDVHKRQLADRKVVTHFNACDLSDLLQCYTEEWVKLRNVQVHDAKSIGTFILGPPPYANPKMATNFQYLTAPTFLVNCFQLAMAHFFAKGLNGGIGELKYDAPTVIRSIKAGGARIARVKELHFKGEITKDTYGRKYDIEHELRHYRIQANQLFFESRFEIGSNQARCNFIGVVAYC